jgi:hypothetical protein
LKNLSAGKSEKELPHYGQLDDSKSSTKSLRQVTREFLNQFLAIISPLFSGLLVFHNAPANFPIRRRHQRVHHARGRAPCRVQQFDDAGKYVVVVGGFVLNLFAGLLFVARFAHKTCLRSLIFTGLEFAWRAIRLVAVTAMKTTGDGMAAAESSRILRFVTSVPP